MRSSHEWWWERLFLGDLNFQYINHSIDFNSRFWVDGTHKMWRCTAKTCYLLEWLGVIQSPKQREGSWHRDDHRACTLWSFATPLFPRIEYYSSMLHVYECSVDLSLQARLRKKTPLRQVSLPVVPAEMAVLHHQTTTISFYVPWRTSPSHLFLSFLYFILLYLTLFLFLSFHPL